MNINLSPKDYPAMVAYIVNLAVAAVVSFHFLSAGTAHALETIVVALTSVIVAFLVHPFVFAAATGAFQTFVVALSSYWLHFSDQQVAAVVGIFGFAVAVITHSKVTPLAAVRAGTTVEEREKAKLSRA